MILEIDTQFLIEHKITAHQFIIVKLLSENQIQLLKKYITYTDTLNDLYKDLDQLKKAGFLTTTFKPSEYISLEKIQVSQKFFKLSSFTEDPFDELYSTFPVKVIRPDGTYDYLRVDKDRCRKLYHNIIKSETHMHNYIIRCLKKEIEDRTHKGKLSYMKRMPIWLASESWNAYGDRVEGDSVTTQGENSKAYGNTIE